VPDGVPGSTARVRILHVSDLHFGPPFNPPVVAALEAHLDDAAYDVAVVSGDLAQRSLSGELQRGAAFLRDVAKRSRVVVVPGNHDVAWWMSPMHLFGSDGLYTRYRRIISADLEPMLDIPGARIVGINTAHGLAPWTLSTRLRDLSVVGAVTGEQLDRTATRLHGAPPGTARVIVMHHNLLRGDLSNRFGIVRPRQVLDALGRAGADLILCGHDHQEDVREVEAGSARKVVVVTAGTLSDRSRGGRPCSFHVVRIDGDTIGVTTHFWRADAGRFHPGEEKCFARS
jgi:3',5'-cyclic AMP phosphodiesterase CpdA